MRKKTAGARFGAGNKVWIGYIQMRVPLELKDQMKAYLEYEKEAFLKDFMPEIKNVKRQKKETKAETLLPPEIVPQEEIWVLKGGYDKFNQTFIIMLKDWCKRHQYIEKQVMNLLKEIIPDIQGKNEHEISKKLMTEYRERYSNEFNR